MYVTNATKRFCLYPISLSPKTLIKAFVSDIVAEPPGNVLECSSFHGKLREFPIVYSRFFSPIIV
jgi:hypothetical protein